MKSSGMKRGLAVAAVSATAVAGLGVLAPSAHAAVVNGYSVVLTPETAATVSAYQQLTYDVTFKSPAGTVLKAGTFGVALSENVPTGGTADAAAGVYFGVNGAAVTTTDASVNGKYEGGVASIAVDSSGVTKVKVAAEYAGTVTLTVTSAETAPVDAAGPAGNGTDGVAGTSDDVVLVANSVDPTVAAAADTAGDADGFSTRGTAAVSASSTFTVTAAPSGDDVVDKVTAAASTAEAYVADTFKFTVNTSAAGSLVNNSGYSYQIDNGSPVAVAAQVASFTTPLAPFSLSLTGAQLGGAGSHTVKFWVNKTSNPAGVSAGLDSGEATASAGVVVDANPTASVTQVASTTGGTDNSAGADAVKYDYPIDTAATVPVTLTFKDATPAAISGLSVVVAPVWTLTAATGAPTYAGVASGAAGAVLTGTTAADGTVTVQVPFDPTKLANTTADSVTKATLTVLYSVTKSGALVAGGTAPSTQLAGVAFNKRASSAALDGLTYTANKPVLQVAPKAAVSVPVKVTDQFGKATPSVTFSVAITGLQGSATAAATVNNTPAGSPKVYTTDANGKAVISYTDGGSASGNADQIALTVVSPAGVAVSAPLNGASTGGVVGYVSTTTADATKSVPSTVSSFAGGVPTVAPKGTGIDTPWVKDAQGVLQPDANLQTVQVDLGTAFVDLGTITAGGAQALNTNASNVRAYNFTVENADGQPLAGQTVTFTETGASAGGAFFDAAGDFGLATLPVKTDATGTATVFLTSFQAADVTVKATAGAASYTYAPIRFQAGTPYAATIDGPTTVTPGTTSKFLATVTDEFGNPIKSTALNFTVGTGAAADPGSVQAATTVTDAAGQIALNLSTNSNESGAGSIVFTGTANPAPPALVAGDFGEKILGGAVDWTQAPYKNIPTTAAALLKVALKSFAGDGVSYAFTVGATAPAQVALAPKVASKSSGATDVISVSGLGKAKGASYSLVGGKKKLTGKIPASGKLSLKAADKSTSKKNTYTLTIAATKATKRYVKKITLK